MEPPAAAPAGNCYWTLVLLSATAAGCVACGGCCNLVTYPLYARGVRRFQAAAAAGDEICIEIRDGAADGGNARRLAAGWKSEYPRGAGRKHKAQERPLKNLALAAPSLIALNGPVFAEQRQQFNCNMPRRAGVEIACHEKPQ